MLCLALTLALTRITPNQEERIIHDIDASPTINTNEYRRTMSMNMKCPRFHQQLHLNLKLKRIIEDSGGCVNHLHVLWHLPDLSMWPMIPSKKSDKQSMSSCLFISHNFSLWIYEIAERSDGCPHKIHHNHPKHKYTIILFIGDEMLKLEYCCLGILVCWMKI